MEVMTSKIEIVFNYVGTKKEEGLTMYQDTERIVIVDGEEIYRDKQKNNIYFKDESILRQFEDWCNEYSLEKPERKNVITNIYNSECFFCKLWSKLFKSR